MCVYHVHSWDIAILWNIQQKRQPDHPNPLYRLYYYYIMCDVIRLLHIRKWRLCSDIIRYNTSHWRWWIFTINSYIFVWLCGSSSSFQSCHVRSIRFSKRTKLSADARIHKFCTKHEIFSDCENHIFVSTFYNSHV